jgi:hypothetical protein
VEVDIPKGKRVSKVHTLMKTGSLQHTISADTLKFHISSVLDYEVVAIDFV